MFALVENNSKYIAKQQELLVLSEFLEFMGELWCRAGARFCTCGACGPNITFPCGIFGNGGENLKSQIQSQHYWENKENLIKDLNTALTAGDVSYVNKMCLMASLWEGSEHRMMSSGDEKPLHHQEQHLDFISFYFGKVHFFADDFMIILGVVHFKLSWAQVYF